MKKFIYIIIFLFIILLFKNYSLILESTNYGVTLWLNKVFPYLFIMIIINDLLINLNISSMIKNTTLYVFIMSLLSGTPTSAYITGNLYEKQIINKYTANNILMFTYFTNPLFLYTILTSIFHNKYIVFKIILIHYLSNIIIYIIHKKKLCKGTISNTKPNFNLPNAIKKSINTNLMVLGSICFFLIISNILINSFNLNAYISILIKGVLEVTQGLNALIDSSYLFKEVFAVIFLSFGGLSIHTQVKCILDDYNLDYKYFLKGRIISIIISIFLLFLIN
jgi:hypothetical protein